jgi:hypothetical protein
MGQITSKLTRRAVRSTARHSARGTTSKLRREPVRAGTLIGIGVATGLILGWAIGRPAATPPQAA